MIYNFFRKPTSLPLFVLFVFSTVLASSIKIHAQASNLFAGNSQDWSFEENRGQLADKNGVIFKDIKYYGRDKGVAVYLSTNKISFVFSQTEPQPFSEATGSNIMPANNNRQKKVNTSNIDLELIDANPAPEMHAEEKIAYYTNYFLAHTPEEGITHVPHFRKITYKNIYKNIDLVLYTKEQGMKYEFIVHRGGKVNDIKLSWTGTTPLPLENGGIRYTTSLGELTESAPFTFTEEGTGKEVKSRFKVKNNIIGFETGQYDRTRKLIIDPTIKWSTYYGGTGDERGNAIVSDKNKYIYVAGSTHSSSSGVATPGAHQTSAAQFWDAFITKFDYNGNRLWGTYYGGNNDDFCYGITIDNNNAISITGTTLSSSGIATIGAHQTTNAGGGFIGDAFIARFNTNGVRQWSTYYGNTGEDLGNAICADSSGSLYFTGRTQGGANMVTLGAHQTTYSGASDAFIAKFDSIGARQWATFYGGSNDEEGYGISADKYNNIYVSGTTTSTSAIATIGAYQTFPGGGFLTKFNNNGVRQWGTYYNASVLGYYNPVVNATDTLGNVYITGNTRSMSGIATAGAHQTSLAGNDDAFIAKFDTAGTLEWGTYYGGSDFDRGVSISTDTSNNVYIYGFTYSTNNLATLCSSKVISGTDGFLAKFNNQGVRQWGTYSSGNTKTVRAALTLGDSNHIYITNGAYITSGITTPGSYQPTLAGGTDAVIVKYENDFPVFDAGILSVNSPALFVCNSMQDLSIRIKNFSISKELDSVFIAWLLNDSISGALKWTGSLSASDTSAAIHLDSLVLLEESNTIKVWTYSPSCLTDPNQANDTINIVTIFNKKPVASITGNLTDCQSIISVYSADNIYPGVIYNWSVAGGSIVDGQNEDSVSIIWNTAGTGEVKLIITGGGGCKDSTTLPVNIAQPAKANFSSANICLGEAISFIDSSINAISHIWDFGDGDTSSIQNPTHSYASPGQYTVTLKVISVNGCTDSISKIVTVYPLPKANFTSISICSNKSAQFIDSSSANGGTIASWAWAFGDGITSNIQNPAHNYTVTGTYDVKLVITTTNGCKDSVTNQVIISALPVSDFSAIPACEGTPVAFTNKSTINTGSLTYIWNFGDGDTSTATHPSHTYAVGGSYKVTLVAISPNNCIDSFSTQVQVFSNPVISWTSVSAGNIFDFLPSDTNLLSYHWSFGGGDTSTTVKPQHIFTKDSTYNVRLTVKNSNGCSAFYDSSVIVKTSSIANTPTQEITLFSVYPNPFNQYLAVEYSLKKKSRIKITITEIAGRDLFATKELDMSPGNHKHNLDYFILNLKPGTYFLHLHVNDRISSGKIMKYE